MPSLQTHRLTVVPENSPARAPILRNIDIQVRPGDRICLVGDSGSGKTTLLRCLLGLIPGTSGGVSFDDQLLAQMNRGQLLAMRRLVQPVFQNPAASLPPRMRVGRLLEEPLRIHNSMPRGQFRAAIEQALQRVDLAVELQHRFPHELSGGQQQRVAIARALLLQPMLLLADEPTSSLDPGAALHVAQVLVSLCESLGLGLLVVTHDAALPLHLNAKVLRMSGGEIVEQMNAETWLTRQQKGWQALQASRPI